MIRVAAKCGIKPDEFWNMSLREFDNYVTGWVESKRQDYEVSRTLTFAAARWQAAQVAAVWSSKAAKKIAGSRFEWEKGIRSKPMTTKQMDTIFSLMCKPKPQA